MATTYSVVTGEGGELGAGMSLDEARRAAQEWANERGEDVFVSGPGLHTAGVQRGSDEDIGECVEPSNRVHVTRVASGGVYGHETRHCDAAGCSGTELYWRSLDAAACTVGDVIAVQE